MLEPTFLFLLLVLIGLLVSLGPPPIGKALPVLMYHQVRPNPQCELAVSPETFDHQLAHLRKAGYESVSFHDLDAHLEGRGTLPRKPVIITFDDGYADLEEYALPILRHHDMSSTFFLPVGMIGKQNSWDDGDDPLLDYDALFRLAEHRVEYGLHTMTHTNLRLVTNEQLKDDMAQCMAELKENQLPFLPVLAYPYGAYHRHDGPKRRAMRQALTEAGIRFAVRIGSRINRIPLLKPYEITRINVHDSDIGWRWPLKLKRGRLRL